MFGSPGPIIARKELKRLAVIKRPDGEILRVSIEQVTDVDQERFHFVCLRPWHPIAPDQHQPAPYAIAVLPGELEALRDALTAAIDQIPAHETVPATEPA
jgi:hypothetical protein